MMAASAKTPPLHFAVTPCPSSKSRVGGLEFLQCSQSVSSALHFDSHGVSKRFCSSSLRSHRVWRKELRPVPPKSQQSRGSSALLSESTSPSPVLDSEDAAGSDSTTFHSQIIREAKISYVDVFSTALGGLGLLPCALQFPEVSLAAISVRESSFPTVITFAGAEPSNALSLPTWVIHVASVVEWYWFLRGVTAMALVWKYGDAEGKSAWKGLTWGMVPLLGGAMRACTWHFFYNAESLEVLVVLQAFLTVVGNFTMWAAAYRIWKLSQEKITVD